MTKLIKKQIGENPPTAKVVLFAIKAFCGFIGASMIIEQSHPYIALCVLAIGAVADQVITMYNWNK